MYIVSNITTPTHMLLHKTVHIYLFYSLTPFNTAHNKHTHLYTTSTLIVSVTDQADRV